MNNNSDGYYKKFGGEGRGERRWVLLHPNVFAFKNGDHLSIYAGKEALGRETEEANEGITEGVGKNWINNK